RAGSHGHCRVEGEVLPEPAAAQRTGERARPKHIAVGLAVAHALELHVLREGREGLLERDSIDLAGQACLECLRHWRAQGVRATINRLLLVDSAGGTDG